MKRVYKKDVIADLIKRGIPPSKTSLNDVEWSWWNVKGHDNAIYKYEFSGVPVNGPSAKQIEAIGDYYFDNYVDSVID